MEKETTTKIFKLIGVCVLCIGIVTLMVVLLT